MKRTYTPWKRTAYAARRPTYSSFKKPHFKVSNPRSYSYKHKRVTVKPYRRSYKKRVTFARKPRIIYRTIYKTKNNKFKDYMNARTEAYRLSLADSIASNPSQISAIEGMHGLTDDSIHFTPTDDDRTLKRRREE